LLFLTLNCIFRVNIDDFTIPTLAIADNFVTAEEESVAMTNPKNMFNDNRVYSDNSIVADAYLAQVSTMTFSGDDSSNTITNHGGISLDDSLYDLTGIANTNLSTGTMNNQAIQSTFAVGASIGKN
jgi:hypothetical protein